MPTLESDITAAGRKIKRLERKISLQEQVIKAYADAFTNPNDITAGIALGTALEALRHFEANSRTAANLAAHLSQMGVEYE